MKIDKRESRPWDLTKNSTRPDRSETAINADLGYASADHLLGWWDFSHTDTGKTEFSSKAPPGPPNIATLTGSFIDNSPQMNHVAMPASSFESPGFLKGIEYNRKPSATVTDANAGNAASQIEGFEVTNFPDLSIQGVTISMTFKLLQDYPQPAGATPGLDRRVNLLSVCDNVPNTRDGRFGISFDNDAYSSLPAISVYARDDYGTMTKTWNAGIANQTSPLFNSVASTRDWIRLDFVIDIVSDAACNNDLWPQGNGAVLYINGRRAIFSTDGTTSQFSNGVITKINFGDLTSGFAGLVGNSRIKLGECAIWNTSLRAREIEFLYQRQNENRSSGVLSNPVRAGSLCGECEHDAYPTNRGSVDQHRLGKITPVFNETGRFGLPVVGNTINYPTLLASGSQSELAKGTLIASPNELPTINTTLSTSSIPQGISNIIYSYKDCNADLDASDTYTPFSDVAAPVELATRVGQLNEVIPGFSKNAGNRIVIDIDVSPTSTKVLQVITGSGGNTYGSTVGTIQPSEENTGLAYFNFETGKFEPMGSRKSETGIRLTWCLPGEVSSSYALGTNDYADAALWKPQWMDNMTFGSARESVGFQEEPMAYYTRTLLNERLDRVPRIFQPYSAIVSHRKTFNHCWATEFDSFSFYAEKRKAWTKKSVDETTLFNELKARSLNQGDLYEWLTLSSLGYGGFNDTNKYREWAFYNSDVRGIGWYAAYDKYATSNLSHARNQNAYQIWNESAAPPPFKDSLSNAFKRTMATMGRPVAYTDWCNNSVFHASSSQTLSLSNYIDSPILLESIDIQASLEAKRYQNPYIKSIPHDRGVGVDNDVLMWSNTNNHIDCLTFFLMRQSNPKIDSADASTREESSKRELITWSNHIFASPFVGWDWIDMNARARDLNNTAGTSYDQLCNRGVWMNGGARQHRAFKVRESDVREMVPGVDSFSYYKTDLGQIQQSNHHWGHLTSSDPGIFFNAGDGDLDSSNSQMDRTGLFTFDLNERMSLVSQNPIARWVTSSIDVSVNVPVRQSPAYLQKTTPILPNVQSNCPHRGVPASDTGGGPYFVEAAATNPGFSAPGNVYQPINQRLGGANRYMQLKPRILPMMGTYWPGGSTTSSRIPVIPTVIEAISASFGSGSVEDNFTQTYSSFSIITEASGTSATAPYNLFSKVLVDAFAPSTRNIVKHPGAFQVPENQRGGKSEGKIKKSSPSFGLSYNATFLRGANDMHYPTQYQMRNPGPGFVSFDYTGSYNSTTTTPSVSNSGYILNPKDELVFGVQWSPADAAHRSFDSIAQQSGKVNYKDVGVAVGTVPRPTTGKGKPPSWGTACYDAMVAAQLGPNEIAQNIYRHAGFCSTNDLAMMASASCAIQKKPMTLRLYGTLLNNNKQKYHSLNQQLTTLCVHEVIGDEPIIDEFDTATRRELSTTQFGKLISGSMIPSSWYGNASFVKSFIGGYYADKSILLGRGLRRSFSMQNLFDVGKVRKVVNSGDVSEYYHDSLVPNLSQSFAAADGEYGFTVANFQDARGGYGLQEAGDLWSISTTPPPIFGGAISLDPTLQSNTMVLGQGGLSGRSSRVWARSFPFEPKYAGIEREFFPSVLPPAFHFPTCSSPATSLMMYSASIKLGSTGGPYFIGFTSGSHLMNSYTDAAGQPLIAYRNDLHALILPPAEEGIVQPRGMVKGENGPSPYPLRFRDDFIQGLSGSSNNLTRGMNHVQQNFDLSGSFKTNMNAYFGVGDTPQGTVGYYYYYLEANPKLGSVFSARVLTQKPRGYKYGLISSTPTRANAVYRRDRYGQFRDMLEQRPFTRMFVNDPADVRASREHAGERVRVNELGLAGVFSTFVEPSWKDPIAAYSTIKKSPAETSTCNLSNFSTSSMPYFDGELKNRDPISTDEVVVG